MIFLSQQSFERFLKRNNFYVALEILRRWSFTNWMFISTLVFTNSRLIVLKHWRSYSSHFTMWLFFYSSLNCRSVIGSTFPLSASSIISFGSCGCLRHTVWVCSSSWKLSQTVEKVVCKKYCSALWFLWNWANDWTKADGFRKTKNFCKFVLFRLSSVPSKVLCHCNSQSFLPLMIVSQQ